MSLAPRTSRWDGLWTGTYVIPYVKSKYYVNVLPYTRREPSEQKCLSEGAASICFGIVHTYASLPRTRYAALDGRST